MRKTSAPHSRSRWSPQNRAGALSLLDQLKRALLDGKLIENQNPEHVRVELPVHVANYLLTAVHAIAAGIDSNAALGLSDPKRGKSNNNRNMLICIEIDQLRDEGLTKRAAVLKVGGKYFLSDDAISTIYQNFSAPNLSKLEAIGSYVANPSDFLADIKAEVKFGGAAAAQEFIDHISKKKSM